MSGKGGKQQRENPEQACSSGAKVSDHCASQAPRRDYLLLISASFVGVFYALHLVTPSDPQSTLWLAHLGHAVFEIVNVMWWGVVLGILMIAVLAKVPREFVMSALGTQSGVQGILRATAAGVLLDLCSHGILMVATKLYERGASTGQVMAFLIASPWNSFSLTLVLIALIGLKWTLLFILISMLIAIVTGLLFDALVGRRILPANPNQLRLRADFEFWREAKSGLANTRFTTTFIRQMLWQGLLDSRMVMRWLLFGVALASLIRVFMPAELYANYFGPSMLGLGLTVLAATLMEVCSEGSAPVAADLLNRANAPGNGFAFLMTGVATDYTEVMVLKDTTHSWKLALFLPLLTVPQVLIVAWLMNMA